MSRSQQYKFIIKKGPNPGHVYPIFADKVTIGRDPLSDIIFKDPEVSRKHVQFTREGSNYFVEDLGSTNGTFIDGERTAGQQIRLQVGQEISLGAAITLIFEDHDKDIDLGTIGTSGTNITSGALPPFSARAVLDDSFAEFRVDKGDEDDEYEAYEENLEDPHIDQLQPLPSLRDKPALHTRVLQSPKNKKPGKATPTPVAEPRTFTNQQIIYLVIGTAVTTVVACGILFLIYSAITGNPLAN